MAFLARYPSPADAQGLGPKRLAGFLARHAYCGRRSAEDLLERLRSAPLAVVGELEAEARRAAVIGLVSALAPIVAQLSQLTSEIRDAVQRHPDGQIFRSFFRDPKSVVCAAGLLAEIGEDRARYRSADALAADAGHCPVPKESGKSRHATFAGPATSGFEIISECWRTRAATGIPGPRTSTAGPAIAAPTTRTRSGSSVGHRLG